MFHRRWFISTAQVVFKLQPLQPSSFCTYCGLASQWSFMAKVSGWKRIIQQIVQSRQLRMFLSVMPTVFHLGLSHVVFITHLQVDLGCLKLILQYIPQGGTMRTIFPEFLQVFNYKFYIWKLVAEIQNLWLTIFPWVS